MFLEKRPRRYLAAVSFMILLTSVFTPLSAFFSFVGAADPPHPTFPQLGDEITVLDYNPSYWDGARGGPHTLDVVELNKDGYRYWGYYTTTDHNAVGLTLSNNLENWTRFSTTTPLLVGMAWPTVGVQNSIVHMIYAKDYALGTPKLVRATSLASDGINFTEQETIVNNANSPHDPFLWNNPIDGEWWLLWKENINVGTIKCCHAKNISDLYSAPQMVLRSETNGYYGTLAAPGIFYFNGTYYLTDESCPGGVWQIRAFYSDVLAEGCFNGAQECSNSPIMSNGDACGFPHVQGNQLYYYWSHQLAGGWNLKLKKASLQPEPTTNLYINPHSVERNPGDVGTTFNVNVTIENVTDLFGFDFNVTWDDNIIALAGVDYESLLDQIWGAGNWFKAKNETAPGWYKLVALSTASSFNTSAAQALATLTFRVENTYSHDAQTTIHFEVAKISDSHGQPIPTNVADGTYSMTGTKPTLQMMPTGVVCRKYCENFTVTINVTDVYNVTDFEFELRFNTSLLDYVNATFLAWTLGNITVDEVGGNLTASMAGDPISGDATLLSVTFQAAYYHVWKNIPGWTNDLSDTIYFQWANLSYPIGEDLGYVRGGLDQINVGPDLNYLFSPIKGDVNNDGSVDVFDLRTVAAYYDVKEGDPLWTEAEKYDLTKPTGENIIDVYDIVVIATNYGFTYP